LNKSPKFIRSDRRNFLKGAAVAGGAAAVAAPVTTIAAEPKTPEVAPVADKGYQENEYIRDYYQLARF
jgi:phosphodiesterase/alkaline phosphatase D-like protein